MDILGIIGGVLFAISFLFYTSARKEIERDYHLRQDSPLRMLKMKRFSGQIMGLGALLILVSFAFNNENQEASKPEESTLKSEEVVTSEEKVFVDTKLVINETDELPVGIPTEYTDRYSEVNETITRTDALLTLIEKNFSKCDGSCEERPLSEIEERFDSMEEVIEVSRNELQKASEIVSEMAMEDPPALNTQKLFDLEIELLATRYSLETMLLADSWESWTEPIGYAESTRVKRLYKVPLRETVLEQDYNVEESTKDNGEPITNEESPEALQSAENVIVGFLAIEDEINALSNSVYESMEADFLTADTALIFIESTREQAVIATNSFNDVEASKELSGAIGKLDDLKEKLIEYESILETSEWNADTYDNVLSIVDSLYEDLEFDPVAVKQFLEVYGY
ncbi:hypothetical protein PJK55_03640 [Exiguobacterium sp. MMG028]|uniref:hypothetical protein n=1 Tax=Exiguobacterium sp. MMG028 TaxID=3021979 RepID=UPI0022FE45B1|nr:hypothetical protein [Exiguobacterium sp. MMG028]MDA5559815.1 hypothetical protein [Exiguobacterium sp. MMG028]